MTQVLTWGLWGCLPIVGQGMDAADPSNDTVDANLVRRSLGGDEAAFGCLVERHQSMVMALTRRILHSEEEAEDVAQDVFVRAWRALHSFRGEARFSTWLYRIAVRRATDAVSSRRRQNLRELPLNEKLASSLADPSPSTPPPRSRYRLERLIRDLPEAQRVAVTVYYLGERSIDEVAEVMGIPPGTVKTLLFRARGTLRRAWLAETREEDDELRCV